MEGGGIQGEMTLERRMVSVDLSRWWGEGGV